MDKAELRITYLLYLYPEKDFRVYLLILFSKDELHHLYHSLLCLYSLLYSLENNANNQTGFYILEKSCQNTSFSYVMTWLPDLITGPRHLTWHTISKQFHKVIDFSSPQTAITIDLQPTTYVYDWNLLLMSSHQHYTRGRAPPVILTPKGSEN